MKRTCVACGVSGRVSDIPYCRGEGVAQSVLCSCPRCGMVWEAARPGRHSVADPSRLDRLVGRLRPKAHLHG